MPVLLTEWKYFLFLVLVTVSCGQNLSDLGPTRYDLIHYLLDERRYDPSLPPDLYTGNITTVSVELSIYDLNSESDIAMEFECTLYLRMKWTDNRLNFTANDTTFDTIDLGDTIVDKTWVPDLYFHHSRKTEMHGLFTKNQLLYIYRNGSVLYSSRFNVKWHCQMNLNKYPFDEPECPIVIQSYSLNKDNLIMEWNGNDAVRTGTGVSLEVNATSMIHTYQSPYDKPVGNFSTLEVNLIYKRPTRSLAIMYIAPAILIVGVSLTSFLLNDAVVSRIGVPTGAMLPLIMQWTGIYNRLPATSELRKLDGWMLGNLISVTIVLVVNALICHFDIIKKKEEEKKTADEEKESSKNSKKDDDETKQPNQEKSSKKKGKEKKTADEEKESSKNSKKDDDETKQPNQEKSSKDTEEEKEKTEQSSSEEGNETKQPHLATSQDKKEKIVKERSIKVGEDTKQPNMNTSKKKEKERKRPEKGKQRNTNDNDAVQMQNIEASKTEKARSSTADLTHTDDNSPLLKDQQKSKNEHTFEKDVPEDSPSENTDDRSTTSIEDKQSNQLGTSSNKQDNISIPMMDGDGSDVDTESSEDELKEDFLQLLKDNKGIKTSTHLEDAEEIMKADPRYKRACKTDKVPQWYREYMDKEKMKDFISLIREKAKTIKEWRRAKMIIDHDPRYKVVDSDDVRQQWFEEYRCCCRKCLCICDLIHWFYTYLIKKCSYFTLNSLLCVFLVISYGIFLAVYLNTWCWIRQTLSNAGDAFKLACMKTFIQRQL